ncbi:NmrA family protein [Micromonospora sp. ATCC 39149]|uniref:NmrA/HSCARG family protein n=1 Tax=Micromonospora carbonacea TaxID=47853 RepID=A0A7D5Y9F0_9ACTN|nr:NmrA/HSCARG family protein [Micromonospora sp. ATCC 39149]EEP72294.1 NmrA family protein [Micromonospora sp. ATCC 39149]QLJ98460.1 NmrA/HSCARG family protein [Micromonospora carbonacea]
MTEKKIIAVVGATGSQGGGLVRAILDDENGPFAARALTRNPDSAAAKEFAARGVEVVQVDLDDEGGLRAAFDGAYGSFVVTNYRAELTPEQVAARSRAQRELDQAANAARAVKAAGLKHVIWSTLEDTRPHFEFLGSEVPTIGDGYKVPHLDAKDEANAYFTGLGVPTTFLQTSFYYEMFITAGLGPHRSPDGELALTLPIGDSVMALVAAEDIGRTAYGIFRTGARFIGRTIGLAGSHATGTELAELFAKVLGEPVAYRPMSHDQLRGAGFPDADELGNMFQFFTDATEAFVGNRDLSLIRTINPRLQTLEDWLIEHREELKSAL